MKLLFDEHASGSYFNNQSEIDKNHESICVGHHDILIAGSKDKKIMKYAKTNDFTIVTKDVKFVKECSKYNAKIAVLKGNYLFIIKSSEQLFGPEPPDRMFTYD